MGFLLLLLPLVHRVFISAAIVGFLWLFLSLYNSLLAKPERLRSALRKQGIKGPKPTLILGNILEIKKARDSAKKATSINGPPVSHNCGSILLPFFDQWRKKYGMILSVLFLMF